ncbi:DEAD/DEAH box helicase [Streptomyces chartreusis]|uniref:DEAD/DEAH box helicase n=1 Tax=Streptomyces chartreusis TaxID=1969 RepID=UPI003816CE6A
MSETPETFKPRPYQTEAIDALNVGWAASANNRLAVVLPTGAGKTVVFANLILEHLEHLAAQGKRALVIAHREELLAQAAAKILAVAPSLRIGFVKAERNEHQDVDVIVASVQTLAVERRRKAIQDIGLIIVDECHHAAAPSYVEVLKHFGAWDGVPTAGFTATMHREEGGLADVWDEVVFTLDILEMIEDGYLCDVRGKRVIIPGLNLDKVKTRNGDLQEGQLGKALDDTGAAEIVAEAYRLHAGDRPGVVFTPTVDTAQSMADAFNDAGIPAAAIWGDMPKEARQTALKWYETGQVQVLTNCMVLTEGFDAPWTSCVVIARPTKSPGLYCQMAGRALRLWEGKKEALILDVMGATTRHKLASIVSLTGYEAAAAEDDERSLREIVRGAEAEAKRAADLSQIQVEEVDLFHGSATRWLRTESGVWFIPVGDATFVFLVRTPGDRTYWMRRYDTANGLVAPQQDTPLPLPEAKAWMERVAAASGSRWLATRSSPWRDKPASVKQLGFCRVKGIQVPPGSTAGDVSDIQAVHQFTAILNRISFQVAAVPAA